MAFRNDQAVFARNGGETITLTAANGTDTYLVTTACRYNDPVKETAPSNRIYLTGYSTWTVPTNGYDVKPGWTITDSTAATHTILVADSTDFAAFWTLDAVDLVIAASLNDTVEVQSRTNNRDTASGRAPVWAAVSGQGSVRCRVQPNDVADYDGRGIRSGRKSYLVYFATAISPTNASGDFNRLLWGSTYLTITKYTQAERIDALPMAECEVTP